MKRKRYIEPLWPLSIFLGVLLVGFFLGLAFTIYLIFSQDGYVLTSYIGFAIVLFMYLACVTWFIIILPRIVSTLIVKNNCIIWHCPFRKKIKMSVKDCEYVGLEDSSQYVYFRYRTQAAVYDALSRGDEMVYIYLSKTPFPKKYAHKAAAAPCKEGFIKFAYSDALCQELIEILPKGKTNALVAFYNRMQAADRVNKLKQQNKKKRKSKKK